MWLVTFCVLSAIASGLCLLGSLYVARNARRDSESLRKKVLSCESQARSITTSLTEWQEVVAQLANSVKMTKVRKALTHTDRDKGGEPDARSDPEAWRAWKNAQLRAGQFNS